MVPGPYLNPPAVPLTCSHSSESTTCHCCWSSLVVLATCTPDPPGALSLSGLRDTHLNCPGRWRSLSPRPAYLLASHPCHPADLSLPGLPLVPDLSPGVPVLQVLSVSLALASGTTHLTADMYGFLSLYSSLLLPYTLSDHSAVFSGGVPGSAPTGTHHLPAVPLDLTPAWRLLSVPRGP